MCKNISFIMIQELHLWYSLWNIYLFHFTSSFKKKKKNYHKLKKKSIFFKSKHNPNTHRICVFKFQRHVITLWIIHFWNQNSKGGKDGSKMWLEAGGIGSWYWLLKVKISFLKMVLIWPSSYYNRSTKFLQETLPLLETHLISRYANRIHYSIFRIFLSNYSLIYILCRTKGIQNELKHYLFN